MNRMTMRTTATDTDTIITPGKVVFNANESLEAGVRAFLFTELYP